MHSPAVTCGLAHFLKIQAQVVESRVHSEQFRTPFIFVPNGCSYYLNSPVNTRFHIVWMDEHSRPPFVLVREGCSKYSESPVNTGFYKSRMDDIFELRSFPYKKPVFLLVRGSPFKPEFYKNPDGFILKNERGLTSRPERALTFFFFSAESISMGIKVPNAHPRKQIRPQFVKSRAPS